MTEAAVLAFLLMTSPGDPSALSGAAGAGLSILSAAPRFAAVPGTSVQQARNLPFDLFAYGGRYYAFHDGSWLSAISYQGPWALFAADRVPAAVRAVLATSSRTTPGNGQPGPQR